MRSGPVVELLLPAEAESFVRLNVPLHFPHLVRLSREAAEILSTCNYAISFPAMTAMSPSVAEALAPHVWPLQLRAFKFVSREVGDALAKHRGALYLDSRRIVQLESESLVRRLAEASETRRCGTPPRVRTRDDREDDWEDDWEEEDDEEERSSPPPDITQSLWGTFNSLEQLTPAVAACLAEGPYGIRLPALRHLSSDLALALVDTNRQLHLAGVATGKTTFDREAVAILATYKGLLFLGNENDREAISAVHVKTRNIDLLGLLVESMSFLHDKQYRSEQRGCSIHELVFRLDSINESEAKALSRAKSSARVYAYLRAPASKQCFEISAASSGCVFLDPTDLSDLGLVKKLTEQILTDGPWGETFPFERISAEAAKLLVAALNKHEASLSLPNMRSLGALIAKELGAVEWGLELEGLTEISRDTAAALIESQPNWMLEGERWLLLRDLETLSADAAESLSNWNGCIDLRQVKHLPEDVLKVFAVRIRRLDVLVSDTVIERCSEATQKLLRERA